MTEIKQISSPNFGVDTIPVEFAVLHYTACSLEDTLKIFRDPQRQVCAHFVLDSDGCIYDLGNFLEGPVLRGAHAGKSSFLHENQKWESFNGFSVGIEMVNFNGNLFPFTEEQYLSLTRLVKHLGLRFPALRNPHRIVGHEQIAGFRGKVDPGIRFDWERFFRETFPIENLGKNFPERRAVLNPELWAEFERTHGKVDIHQMKPGEWGSLSSKLEAFVANVNQGEALKMHQKTSVSSQVSGLDSLKSVHVIGVGGTLMGAFAAYLKRRGLQVSGSDQSIYPPMSDVLAQAGVEIYSGYRAENLTALSARGQKPDLVVIGNVITSTNPEARAAIEGNYNYSSLPEAMERLFLKDTRNLVVAGTHGKTTSSSLLSHTLVSCGKDPSYFIGGVSHDLPFSFHLSNTAHSNPGSLFVLEGDEYDTAFWDKVPKFNHYLPNDVILTSVEYDHADIYPDLDAVVRAFQGLVSRVRPGGRIIGCYDYPIIQELLSQAPVEVLSYGSNHLQASQNSQNSKSLKPRFTVGSVKTEYSGSLAPGVVVMETHFEVLDRGKCVAELSIQIPGMHNVLNALAVWIECRELNLPPDAIATAFRSFRGVKRRQEVRGKIGGVTVVDDFAHHPTAVRETLRAFRIQYPNQRLISVFEPRSATSRRKVFQSQYVDAFQEADLAFIAKPFDQTKIDASNQFSSEQLVEDLVRTGKAASLMSSVDEGVSLIAKLSQPGDVIAVLSNGGFGDFIAKLLSHLRNRFG